MPGRADICGVGTSFNAKRWLSLNPCGYVGISLSFSVHIFAAAVTVKHLIAGSFFSQVVFILLYLPLSFMALWSLFMAWTTNPGAVPLGARPLVTVSRAASGELCPSAQARKRGLRRCPKCNDNYKPNRAHHDSVTGRCIVKFDHYCPWVCNAVGAMNHKFFFLFVFYTMNTCITSLFMIIVRAVRCGHEYDNDSSSSSTDAAEAAFIASTTDNTTVDGQEEVKAEEKAGDMDSTRDLFRGLQSMAPTSFIYEECQDFHNTYMVIILFVVAITFFIFTSCMMVEQVEAIQTNQSKIARMKMRVGQGTELERVTEQFNEMFGGNSPNVAWHWFVPLKVQFPGSMHKVVMGFEWDPTFDPLPYREDRGNVELSSTSSAGEAAAAAPTQPVDEEGAVEPPRDVETGMVPTDLDEVSIDSNDESGRLKKRSVSHGSSLPELA